MGDKAVVMKMGVTKPVYQEMELKLVISFTYSKKQGFVSVQLYRTFSTSLPVAGTQLMLVALNGTFKISILNRERDLHILK